MFEHFPHPNSSAPWHPAKLDASSVSWCCQNCSMKSTNCTWQNQLNAVTKSSSFENRIDECFFFHNEVLFSTVNPNNFSSAVQKFKALPQLLFARYCLGSCLSLDWFSLLSHWNLQGNLPEKCCEMDNTADYRTYSKVNGQWRQHLEVNMKNVVLGESCESPHSCRQNETVVLWEAECK